MTRASGIFRQEQEEVSKANVQGHFLYITGVEDTVPKDVHLITDETFVWVASQTGPNAFVFPSAYQQLGLFRDNWKQGRSVEGISALQLHGVRVDFGAVNVAYAGKTALALPIVDSQGINVPDKSQYVLVAEIVSECPPHPQNGTHATGVDCVAMVTLTCDTFPPDVTFFNVDFVGELFQSDEFLVNNKPIDADYRCDISTVEFVWGTNLYADKDLVLAIAAVYSRNRASVRESLKQFKFTRNAVLGAMFLLSTSTNTQASTKEEVKPTISLVYIIFMILPVFVGFLLLTLLLCKKNGVGELQLVPTTAWEVLMTGREHVEAIPHRSESTEPFPPAPDGLLFGYNNTTDENYRLGLYEWDHLSNTAVNVIPRGVRDPPV